LITLFRQLRQRDALRRDAPPLVHQSYVSKAGRFVTKRVQIFINSQRPGGVRLPDLQRREFLLRCTTAALAAHNHNESILCSTTNLIFAALSRSIPKRQRNWRKGPGQEVCPKTAGTPTAAQRLLKLESQIVIQDEVWQHLQPLVSGPALPSLRSAKQIGM